jgi:hypothetical protein
MDDHGRALYGCNVDVAPLRSLPGHTTYRIQRFGYGLDGETVSALLRELAEYARSRRNVLRVVLETFAGDVAGLRQIGSAASDLGLAPNVPPQRYTRTLRLDFGTSVETTHESLPRTAKRNLKLAAKSGLKVRVIEDPALAPALASLEREAFARTGGHATETDWPRLIAYARAHPRLVRIVGLFAEADGAAPDLLGFATGRSHGDHVEYAIAGTTRRPGIKISLGYPIMWNLIEWAHEIGATWFDFGGITGGSAHSTSDALGGISDFKRHFGGAEIEVGGEWALDVSPVRSAVANALSGVARALRRGS